MKKIIPILLIILLAFPSFAYATEAPEKTELLILVEENTSNKEIKSISKEAGGTVQDIDALSDDTKLVKITVNEDETEEITEILEDEESVIFVQPNYIYHLDAEDTFDVEDSVIEESVTDETNLIEEEAADAEIDTEEAELTTEEVVKEEAEEVVVEDEAEEFIEPELTIKSDEYRDNQWYLDDINATESWELAGDNEVIVAVVDTGCQLDHPDLSSNILKDKCVSFNNGQQGSFTAFDDSEDDTGHGTHVCGIIAAEVDNDEGISGVANNKAKLIVIDAMSKKGITSTQDVVLAVNYAIKQKAQVINLSLSGGLFKDYILDNSISTAYNNGIVCVCAAGNENTDAYTSPSDALNAISVMSHTRSGVRADSSSFGLNKDVSAPGDSVYSTYLNSSYKTLSGTSMATPVVSGIVSLLLSKDPTLTPREIKNIIYASGGDEFGTYSFGKVNAEKALNSLTKTSPNKIVLNRDSLSLFSGEEVSLEYSVLPGGAYSSNVAFTSSDSSVVTVDNGIVTAVSPGTATITVSSGSIKATCPVTVKGYEYTKVSVPSLTEGRLDSNDPKVKITIGSSSFDSYMDGYEMNLTQGERLSIKVKTSTVCPFVRILRDNNVIAEKYTTLPKDYSFSYEPKVSGTYQLQILNTPSSTNFSEYTYKLELHIHDYEIVPAKEATCTEDGWESYKKCSCGGMADLNGKVITKIPVIEASHDWGEPVYTWNDTSVTAKRVCKRDSSHVETETVEASSEVVRNATTSQEGLVRYTATFKNTAFTTQTKDVTTDKLVWGMPVYTWNGDKVTARRAVGSEVEEETVQATSTIIKQPTCTSEGTRQYTATFKNSAFTTQTKTVSIDKTEHNWGEPVYSWSGTRVTAKRVCKTNSSHVESETVTATSSVVNGATVYTATFKNSAFKTQTKKAEQWSSATYTWSSDYSTVTASRYNIYTPSEVKKETVKTTKSVITPSTCDKAGSAQYKGVFSDGSTTYKTVSLPLLEHTWNTPTYTWSKDYSSVTATRTCKQGHRQTETVKTTARVTKAATASSMGQTTYTATFKNTAFKAQSKTITNINKLVVLPSVKISKLTKAKKSFVVKWSKLSSANQKKVAGIQIQYCPNRNFKTNVKTINVSRSLASKKITRLAAKKTYYVRMRTYKSGSYSSWSAVKTIKTK